MSQKLPRDINKEMFTKRVAVRAVELSIGAFCTEFRCDQLCDGDILGIAVKFGIFHEKGRRESSEAVDHCILHRISLRIQPCGRFFASSHLGKLDFSGFPADFFINSVFFSIAAWENLIFHVPIR